MFSVCYLLLIEEKDV